MLSFKAKFILSDSDNELVYIPPSEINAGLGNKLLRGKGCFWGYQTAVACVEAKEREIYLKCKKKDKCLLPFLYKPQSMVTFRTFARPIRITIDKLEGGDFLFWITAWGRKASSKRGLAIIANALAEMGEEGVKDIEGKFIPFEILGEPKIEFKGDIRQFSSQLFEGIEKLKYITLELITPVKWKGQTDSRRQTLTTPNLAWDKIFGEVAYDLVAWDLEDRGMNKILGRTVSNAIASSVRTYFENLFVSIEIEQASLYYGSQGVRCSRKSGNDYKLDGLLGSVILRGELSPLKDILAVMAIWGCGQDRSNGLGRIKLGF